MNTDIYNPFSLLKAFSDLNFGSYTIGVPNEEVKFGMYKRLLPLYLGYPTDDKKIEIVNFQKALRDGKVEEFMERINNIFAAAPKQTNQKQYELNCKRSNGTD